MQSKMSNRSHSSGAAAIWNRGRLTAELGRSAVSSPGARSQAWTESCRADAALPRGADCQLVDECTIVAEARRLQSGHLALVVPLPDTHGFLVKKLGLEFCNFMRRHGAALQLQCDYRGRTQLGEILGIGRQ